MCCLSSSCLPNRNSPVGTWLVYLDSRPNTPRRQCLTCGDGYAVWNRSLNLCTEPYLPMVKNSHSEIPFPDLPLLGRISLPPFLLRGCVAVHVWRRLPFVSLQAGSSPPTTNSLKLQSVPVRTCAISNEILRSTLT